MLVRDVAYGQLPRAARADKHRRAAEWIQALSPDRAEDRAELLAHHWQAAFEFARAAGQDTAALAEHARVSLQDAAVLGKVAWLGGLAALAGTEPFLLEERLHTLERKEFLRRDRRSAVAGERQYVFRHALVRDVAYGQLPRAARADKHRRAAEWLQALS